MTETKKLYENALSSTPQSEEQNILQNTEQVKGLLAPQDSFTQSLGGPGQSALSQAIQNKYNQKFGADQAAFKRQAKLDAKNATFSKLQAASNLAAEESKINFQKHMAKYKQKMARKAARGQLLGSVLGIGGGVVGAIFGGPAGAVAGASLGQGVGQAVGSQ